MRADFAFCSACGVDLLRLPSQKRVTSAGCDPCQRPAQLLQGLRDQTLSVITRRSRLLRLPPLGHDPPATDDPLLDARHGEIPKAPLLFGFQGMNGFYGKA